MNDIDKCINMAAAKHVKPSSKQNQEDVDIGFVEETDSWRLLSHFCPSKVGGFPAWLSLKPLPQSTDLLCKNCNKPTVFLMQIYAPVTEKDSCFHRTLFVFICRDPACSTHNDNRNVLVYRSQLSRKNDFYSYEPPDLDKFDPSSDHPSTASMEDLCVVCGCAGSKQCAKCHGRSYCSKDHQTIDWKAGHKQTCDKQETTTYKLTYNFPEYEIVSESENYPTEAKSQQSESERLQEYDTFLNSLKGMSLLKESQQKDLETLARSEGKDDKIFNAFQARISHEPEQVIRYNKGGSVLWVSSEHLPTPNDIPKCKCGAARHFEFQIMPQMLIHLAVDSIGDSIDWGTLAVYTCSNSCDIGNSYSPEFVWKQDFTPDD